MTAPWDSYDWPGRVYAMDRPATTAPFPQACIVEQASQERRHVYLDVAVCLLAWSDMLLLESIWLPWSCWLGITWVIVA